MNNGTAGSLIQGGQLKQQMNFTSYETGFGAASRGSGIAAGNSSGMTGIQSTIGKSSRAHNDFGQSTNTGSKNTLIKKQTTTP
jgi:hypothetical protein